MILLTGATGYLGSQIAQELVRRGEPFREMSIPAPKPGANSGIS